MHERLFSYAGTPDRPTQPAQMCLDCPEKQIFIALFGEQFNRNKGGRVSFLRETRTAGTRRFNDTSRVFLGLAAQ